MTINKFKSITEEPVPGTVSISRTITDEKPQVYIAKAATDPDREAYEIAQEEILNDPDLSGGEKAERLGEGEPEETLKERLARAKD
ncbi:hypothetical protein CQ018_19715 [Arthrobacter sp. MYb227]|uniref:hypothetical protein n=1 Tax=Arthrobacter sp. MYb227 TaxID=1848601 RepID=UPI000CFA871B|nr:hypothetical protein [Arthrobacter sp. MYb227]PQZ85454.1 hypothetical protein CQ018_19715 [Arthrobacter sp. MYb227]